ncbi:hypothetical protein D9619_005092 [Psilocybe cf. subviscida]|uniref:Amino acid permease/ SLC12A domain-containing protein n=1 Tax=Psilocybe cf. subviscida TaxID=2480587 RepID=A0A8H5BPS2_9AGAR|nr:hypothetical protein D9619_005092 [Psilocybe cf. subviscida]
MQFIFKLSAVLLLSTVIVAGGSTAHNPDENYTPFGERNQTQHAILMKTPFRVTHHITHPQHPTRRICFQTLSTSSLPSLYSCMATPSTAPSRDHDGETQPLLQVAERNHGVARHTAPGPTRQIGVVTAMFMIFNRMIGTGVFATPSTILGFSGSVGLALGDGVMWVIGALFALCGMQVYIIWGTALPHNGGEKNYLEHLFPRPPRLISSIYAGNAVLLAYTAGNALVFTEYSLASLSSAHPGPPSSVFSLVRIVAFLTPLASSSSEFFIVVGATILALSGSLHEGGPLSGNFDDWETIWEGLRTRGSVVYASVYNVIWSFVEYSKCQLRARRNKAPARMLRVEGLLPISAVGLFYVLSSIAHFTPASNEEITGYRGFIAAAG